MKLFTLFFGAIAFSISLIYPTQGVAILNLDRNVYSGGKIPTDVFGQSIEWSLIYQYFGTEARSSMVNIMNSFSSGIIRIGGGTQEICFYGAGSHPITDDMLLQIKLTFDQTPGWKMIMGTCLDSCPNNDTVYSENLWNAAVKQGLDKYVISMELGNEPDISSSYTGYNTGSSPYLPRLQSHMKYLFSKNIPVTENAFTQVIEPWSDIANNTNARWFWDWRDAVANTLDYTTSNEQLTDHNYMGSRSAASTSYGYCSIPNLFDISRQQDVRYKFYSHADSAISRNRLYRTAETNTCSGRGASGVSNVAAAAIYAVGHIFNQVCPLTPDPTVVGGNQNCSIQGLGVNFHNAEVNSWFVPNEGNAYYNQFLYTPSSSYGPVRWGTPLYGSYFMTKYASGLDGLRPAPSSGSTSPLSSWRLNGINGSTRLFVLNRETDSNAEQQQIIINTTGSTYRLVRLSPHDPTNKGLTLTASGAKISARNNGVAVDYVANSDGTFPTIVDSPISFSGSISTFVNVGEAIMVEVT